MRRILFRTALLLMAVLLSVTMLPARSKKSSRAKPKPKFDYYLLTLSYAPDFCAQNPGKGDESECGIGRKVGFVVHGMWPQSEGGRGPEACAPQARKIPQDILDKTLPYIPGKKLILHEWNTHGTCSGLTMADYFNKVKEARDGMTIPAALTPAKRQVVPKDEVIGKMRKANPSYPPEAFRISCYGNGELQEVRVCLDKTLKPRPCGKIAESCQLSEVTLLGLR